MRRRISITLEISIIDSLNKEAKNQNISVSRLIENELRKKYMKMIYPACHVAQAARVTHLME